MQAQIVTDVATLSIEEQREHIRGRAYPIWAWECGQNAERLADWIAEHWGVEIPARTIRYWSKQDGWRLRYESDRVDIDPGEARPAIALRLQSAALGAAIYLDAVNNGEVAPDKARLFAAKVALDASGFASIRVTGEEANHRAPSASARVSYSQLTDAELAERMRAIRSGSSPH